VAKEKKINEELQKVSSNNILEIFEIIETKQYVWYLTEYCSGGSLWYMLTHPGIHSTKLKTISFLNWKPSIASYKSPKESRSSTTTALRTATSSPRTFCCRASTRRGALSRI
jgi:serine/threonine protein kinase